MLMETWTIQNLKLDEGFRTLLPSLTCESREQLEQNIHADGFTDAIVVWQETGILVDGYNRQEIWASCPSLTPPRIEARSFVDRSEVERWMIERQLGRRNLKPAEASYLRGLLYNKLKGKQGGTGSNQHTKKEVVSTATVVADQTGVSQATVRRDAKFAKDLDKINKDSGPAVKQEVLASGNREHAAKVASLPPGQQPAAAKEKPPRKKPAKGPAGTALRDIRSKLDEAVKLVRPAEKAHGGPSIHSKEFVSSFTKVYTKLQEWEKDVD